MAAITGRGDEGETDLLFGHRVAKDAVRIELVGTVDELNAVLGLARASGLNEGGQEVVDRVQQLLVGLMGQMVCREQDRERYRDAGFARVDDDDVRWLEELAGRLEDAGANPEGWARPGASREAGGGRPMVSAALDLARAVARRAERRAWTVDREDGPLDPVVLVFLNRLSDLLWLMAR
jgi:cob(I)alamin adenosyltransferase